MSGADGKNGSVDRPAPNPVSLTGKQRRALRGLGHALKPVVQIGAKGVSPPVVQAAVDALDRHELIKVTTLPDGPLDRKAAPAALAEATGAHVAQVIGRTALLYRRRFESPEVVIPGPIEEAPRPAEDAETAPETATP